MIEPGRSYSVGRQSKNDIVINHPSVSRLHLMLEWDELGVRVQDMKTRNGTYLKGKRLREKVTMKIGEAIEISAIRIQLLLPEPAHLEMIRRKATDSVNIQSNAAVQGKLLLVDEEPGFAPPDLSLQARIRRFIKFCTTRQNVKNALIFIVSCLLGLFLFFAVVHWL